MVFAGGDFCAHLLPLLYVLYLRLHSYSSFVVCMYPWVCVRLLVVCVCVTGIRACLCEGLAQTCLWEGCVPS